MSLERQVRRVGGSLAVTLPRDVAEAMQVKAGSPIRLTVIGRQVVIEPTDDTLPDAAFQRAMAAVMRRHAGTFERLAAFDRQEWSPPKQHRRRKKNR